MKFNIFRINLRGMKVEKFFKAYVTLKVVSKLGQQFFKAKWEFDWWKERNHG